MPSRNSRLFAAVLALVPVAGAVAPSEGWLRVLESVGLDSDERVHVLTPTSPRSTQPWPAIVGQGAYLILEGESEAATAFGFRPGSARIRVRNTRDTHSPGLPVIWERELELPVFNVPPEAAVFARERWSGGPLLAGFRKGRGAVLWAASPPGDNGYERYPFILHALRDLGLEPRFHSRRLWAFFDSSYRMRVAPAYMARRWRSAGIAALHVAAWHYFEPDKQRDQYLRTLLDECHRAGILVYAWLELPHVSERFWADHPEWREKTALGQDAHLDWRRLMNLANPDCHRAVAEGIRALIGRFEWDGVNLAELYFESPQGAANPARFTPMNEDVRREFRQIHRTDPLDLFRPGASPGGLRPFLDYRADLARRIEARWVDEIESLRKLKPELDLVLTHVDDLIDPAMRDALGASAAAILHHLRGRDLTFMVEDPATVWHLGPQRYPEIARRYERLPARPARLAVDINVVERYQDVYPTKLQTGTELFQLVRYASRSFGRVALYFENSIAAADLPFLPAASTVAARTVRGGFALSAPAGVRWSGPVAVDGKLWPATDGDIVWLPAGSHQLRTGDAHPPIRLLDLNADLMETSALDGALEFSYSSPSRAIAVLSTPPARVDIDGIEGKGMKAGPSTLVLPRGQHRVKAYLN